MKQERIPKRMGRPLAANPKTQLVHVRLSDSLLADIDGEIDPHVGQDRSQVIRMLLVEAIEARRMVKGRRTE